MRRGILGGSFDPVHLGHLRAAGAAADRLRLAVVHFVPAGRQPFKRGRHHAGAADRAAMLERAVAADRRFVLDRREVERGGPSYTVDTLREIAAQYPDDPLFLLVGADAARDLSEWHQAREIAGLATVVAMTRPGFEPVPDELVTETIEVPPVDIS
ncbi:MAG: nicotinate (nicotinamide) nucleotide adenylyltransferase, partial [Armatimonadota bacterium]